MNYVSIYYGLLLIIVTIESSGILWYNPVAAAELIERDDIIDVTEELEESELLIEAEQRIIDGKHREWKACLESSRSRIKCNDLYESTLKEEKPLTRLKHYHALLEEAPHHHKHCRVKRSHAECVSDKHDRQKRMINMEKELYPWKEMYDICIAVLTRKQCHNIIDEIQIPKYRTLVPESLITIAKAHICLDAGRSEEDCELEANEHYEQFVAPSVVPKNEL